MHHQPTVKFKHISFSLGNSPMKNLLINIFFWFKCNSFTILFHFYLTTGAFVHGYPLIVWYCKTTWFPSVIIFSFVWITQYFFSFLFKSSKSLFYFLYFMYSMYELNGLVTWSFWNWAVDASSWFLSGWQINILCLYSTTICST